MEEKGFEIKNMTGDDGENTQPEQKFVDFSIDDTDIPLAERATNATPKKPAKENADVKGKSKKKKKSSGTVKGIIWVLVIILISVGIAFGIIYAGADYLGLGFGRGGSCIVNIPQGTSATEIAYKLEDSGAVKLPLLFRVYSKLKHYDSQYKYGVYNFKTDLGYEDIAAMLMTEGAKAKTVKVKIIEGSSVDEIAETLESNGICEKSDFINEVQSGDFDYDFVKNIPTDSVYYRLEGYLFPDTYEFYACEESEDSAHLAVEMMLSNFDKKTKDIRKVSGDYSFHEIMTMASIVELEAGGCPAEMPKVAAVFYNRLNSDDFSTLGSSPTRKYPHGDGRYDTYTCQGLPPGPLCAPGLSSIKAAISPDKDMDCFYFVTDKSMNFYYRKTLSEHNAIISKLQAEDNWIYEE